jgi:hypothetical protein
MRRTSPALFLLGLVLAGCGGRQPSTEGDTVKPNLPRVTVEVKGMH